MYDVMHQSGWEDRSRIMHFIWFGLINFQFKYCVIKVLCLMAYYKADGKPPDGITLASWKCGQLLVWDATALTPMLLYMAVAEAGAVAFIYFFFFSLFALAGYFFTSLFRYALTNDVYVYWYCHS